MKKDFLEPLFKSPLFWLGLAIKLVLIPVFGSEYLTDLFIPFMDRSVTNVGINPWALAQPNEFPYGGVLFFVIFVPKYLGYLIFGDFSLGLGWLNYVLIKLPLLVFDFLLLWTLYKLNGRGLRRLLLYYWINPILIFISYYLGQLDVVCMAFLFLSLMNLLEKRHLISSLMFGGAVLCKFHVVLLIPFILAFLWNNYFISQALRRILIWSGVVLVLSVLGFLPHLTAGNAGYVSGGSPEAQRIFAMALNLGGQETLLLGVFALLLLLGRLCLSTKIGASGLLHGCGALMTLLVLTVNPAAGWFFWFLPFVALLYAQYVGVPRLLYVGLCISYFLHFFINKEFQILPVQGLSLTLLQAFTACFLIAIHILVLRFDAPIFRRLRPYLIGIGGDSGAGKNYLSGKIQDLFGEINTRVIEGDDYHKWERGDQNWKAMTHLNPRANNLETLMAHSAAMSRGQTISTRHYDHQTGKFTGELEVTPAKTIVVQGLHTLFAPLFREGLDLKIFLKPSEAVRKAWKMSRDVGERGHSPEKVIESLEGRKGDSQKYIDPQEQGADWVLGYQVGEKGFKVLHQLRNIPGASDFFEALKSIDCQIHFVDSEQSGVLVEVQGNPTAEQVERFAQAKFASVRQLLRTWMPPRWSSGLDGVHQLILIYILSSARSGLQREDSWL